MESLGDSFGDAFITLPLLIIGFIFFLGTLTSNIGLLYLFLGHLGVVPALQFLGNETRPFGQTSDINFNFKNMLYYFLSWGAFMLIHSFALKGLTGSDLSHIVLALGIPSVFLHIYFRFFGRPVTTNTFTFLDLVNIPYWRSEERSITESAPACNLLPYASSKSEESPSKSTTMSSPSNWMYHIVFFFGFIFANALALYNVDVPEKVKTNDPKKDAERNANIELRVSNRKSICIAIMILPIIILGILLWLRFTLTACEGTFFSSLTHILITYGTGISFCYVLIKNCGVRPADVLGIVQGMISTDLIDNPIVCVGTPQ